MSDGAGKYERLTEAGIENVVRSFFDEYEKENAEFRSQSGLAVEVIREEVGDCCDWCADIAGNYDYWDAPKEVWQRHEHCRCMVITRTTKGTYQDAWSRKEYQSRRDARIAREEEINREGSTILLSTSKYIGEKAKKFSERGIPLPKHITEYQKELRKAGDYLKVPRGSVKYDDLRILSIEEDVEFALVTINDYVYIMRGEEHHTEIPEKIFKEMKEYKGTLDVHSHPFLNDLIPSMDDRDALKMLPWQESSDIIDEKGEIVEFNVFGIIRRKR